MIAGDEAVDATNPTDLPDGPSSFARGLSSWTDILPKTDHVNLFLQADFASTPLGPISEWGPALRFYTSMVFSDTRPANLHWGPERIAIYNEEYAPLLAEAHPFMMGKSLRAGLGEGVWDDTTVIFEKCITAARAVGIHNLEFWLLRQGLLEETYFDGQFLPLRGDSGGIEGVYNTATESTDQVLHDRQRRIVDQIASVPNCPVELTLTHIVDALRGNSKDIPMAMLYSYDELVTSSGKNLHLRGSIGVPDGHSCAPHHASLENDASGIIPFFRQAKSGGIPVILSMADDLPPSVGSLFEGLSWCGHAKASHTVVAAALKSSGRILGFYIQGLNPHRPYDEAMEMGIVDTIRQIEAKWASSISAEEAKQREEMLERKLTHSERRLRYMARSAPIGMCQITPDGHFEWCNEQFHEITGFPRDKYNIREFLEFIAPEDRAKSFGDFTNLLDGAHTLTSELRLNRSWSPPPDELHEGEDISDVSAWILTTAFAINENGKPKLIMGYVTDISRQKWAESVQARTAAAATLARRRQEEFIDTTSHEMRNPLSAITQLADGIARSLPQTSDSLLSDAGYKEIAQESVASANIILACAAHQKRVIDDVLILSCLESEMLSITPVTVLPGTVVDNAVRMLRAEADMNGMEIEACRDSSYESLHVGHVLCDTSRLTQILINLISNAIKFTGSRPERKISVLYGAQTIRPPRIRTIHGELEWVPSRDLERLHATLPALKEDEDKMYLYFCVQDTGLGLTNEEMNRLFKRFAQASSKTHVNYGGSGLGLYISKELAEKQGGQVGVASRRDQGAVFAFYIETRNVQAMVPQSGEGTRPRSRAASFALKRPDLPRQVSTSAIVAKTGDKPKSTSHDHSAPLQNQTLKPSPPIPPSQGQQSHLQQAYQRPASAEGFHIILVEDNLVNQKVLAKQLRNAKCTVTIANHGLECLEVLKKTKCWLDAGSSASDKRGDQTDDDRPKVDVILMDWEMPKMDGLACTKRIRALEEEGQITRRLPVIATTANVRQEQINRALAAGMDSVLSKPFSVSELLERIQTTLEASVKRNTSA